MDQENRLGLNFLVNLEKGFVESVKFDRTINIIVLAQNRIMPTGVAT